MTERVLLDVRHDGAGRVALNRAEKYNGLDLPMLRALVEVPKRIAADPSIRAVILSGEGKAFCAGLDFASVAEAGRVATARGFSKLPGQNTTLFQRACWAWRELPVPVLAVLHGHCFGGGLQLDGRRALEYGLVTGVADDPLKEAEALVGQLVQRSPVPKR